MLFLIVILKIRWVDLFVIVGLMFLWLAASSEEINAMKFAEALVFTKEVAALVFSTKVDSFLSLVCILLFPKHSIKKHLVLILLPTHSVILQSLNPLESIDRLFVLIRLIFPFLDVITNYLAEILLSSE